MIHQEFILLLIFLWITLSVKQEYNFTCRKLLYISPLYEKIMTQNKDCQCILEAKAGEAAGCLFC